MVMAQTLQATKTLLCRYGVLRVRSPNGQMC